MRHIDGLDGEMIKEIQHDQREKLDALNRQFSSKVKEQNGIYGGNQEFLGDGVVLHVGKTEENQPYQEYYKDGKLYAKIEKPDDQNHTEPESCEQERSRIRDGLVAAGIQLSESLVDNIARFADGTMSAEQMVMNITKDTAEAGWMGYGHGSMPDLSGEKWRESSEMLIRRVGENYAEEAVITFALHCHHTISEFLRGRIDQKELARDLAADGTVTLGEYIGKKCIGIVGSDTILGKMLGLVITLEQYAGATEAGAKGKELLGEKAVNIAAEVISYVEKTAPGKVAGVRSAFNDFFHQNRFPFKV